MHLSAVIEGVSKYIIDFSLLHVVGGREEGTANGLW